MKIAKQKRELKLYAQSLEEKRAEIASLKKQVEELQILNLNLQRQQLASDHKPNKRVKVEPCSSSPPSFKYSPAKLGSEKYPSSPLATLKLTKVKAERRSSSPPISKYSPQVDVYNSPSWSPVASPKSIGSTNLDESSSHSAGAARNNTARRKVLHDTEIDDDSDEELPFAGGKQSPPMVVSRLPTTVKSPFKGETAVKTQENQKRQELQEIPQRIYLDLSGKKPLETEGEDVVIGMGLKVNKKTWEKVLRQRKDDSKFFKDIAGVVWGKEALKKRTALRSTSDKKPCTPKKKALCEAILKGKMMARNESEEQQKFVLKNLTT